MTEYTKKASEPNRYSRKFSLREWIDDAKVSKNFDAFRVYVIEVWDDNERFIKIGRSFCTVKSRFTTKEGFPYQYKILYEVCGNPFHIFNLETKLKREFKQYRIQPLKQFIGSTECFSIEIIPLINIDLDVNSQ